MPNKSGFTLIELLIVMAIVAILSMIAWPSYLNYVNKSKTAYGQQTIASAMNTLEQQFLDKRTYPATDAISDGKNYFAYTYTQLGNPPGQTYSITAIGNGALSQYFIAANSTETRCVCLNCATNPFTAFNDTTMNCPANSTAW